MSTTDIVMEALREVVDPELELSLVDLGLIYNVRFEKSLDGLHVDIDMTLTSPGCPVGPELMASVHRAAIGLESIDSVKVHLVWSPRWDPRKHATEEAQFEMDIF